MKKSFKKIKETVMTDPGKDHGMPLPLPEKEKKRLVQAEINQDLFDSVNSVMKKKGLKIKDVVEWGFSDFLLRSEPKEAARLGIKQKP